MLTPDEWQEIEKKLQSFFSMVKLNCDGYKISLFLVRVSQFKNVIEVYINGQIKGEWCTKECEESRRFLRKVTKSLMSQKQKMDYKKFPKRLQKQLKWEDRKYSYYVPYWTSFKSLKKQLNAQNSSIELIHED